MAVWNVHSPSEAEVVSLSRALVEGKLSRRDFIRRAAAMGIFVSGASPLLAACSSDDKKPSVSPSAQAKGQPGGILRVAEREGSTADLLDPALILTLADSIRINNLWDHLTRYGSDFSALPHLAESWEASPDAKDWTFRLVDGAAWHDGEPVTADDVVFTFQRLLDPGTGTTQASQIEFMEGADIQAVDPRTVRFQLQQGYVDLPFILAADFTAIVPSHAFDSATVNDAPVAGGPFKFESLKPGESSVFVRNDDYWREGYPYVDELHILNVFDETARNNGLLSGEIDFSASIDFSSIDVIEGGGGKVYDLPGGAHATIVAAVDAKGPISDQRVREALAYSVDRQQIVDVVFRGHARVANDQSVADSLPFAPQGIEFRERDIPRAKQLLADAGYPDGVDVELISSETVFSILDVAVAVAEQAKESGFRIKVNKWPVDTFWTEVWLKKDFYMTAWTGRPVPDILLSSSLISSAAWNEPHFFSDEFDSLVVQARETLDEAERTELYTEAMQLVHDSASYLTLAWINMVHGATQSFNFEALPPPIGHIIFAEAWLAS